MALGNADTEQPEHKDIEIASHGATVLVMEENECMWVQGVNVIPQFEQQQERAGVEEMQAFMCGRALQKGPSACEHPSLACSWHQCWQVVPLCRRL